MKKYENLEIELIFLAEDVVRTSQSNDNVTDMPDFPEYFG